MDMDIKNWAVAGAVRFESVWAGVPDFWKRSNTFHAYLRFVDAAVERWGDDSALVPMKNLRTTMVETNVSYFPTQIGGNGVWADDYGWCGISCLAARDYLLSINDQALAERYLDSAMACWKQMCATGYDNSGNATPVPHGCGNVSPKRKPIDGYGTRNTVTNSNLLLLSLRLYAATKDLNYLSMAFAQYKWFATWLTVKYQSLDAGPYVRAYSIGPPYCLIHERPMAEQTYTKILDPIWNKGWVWTGDQGLTMMALAELYQMRDEFAQFPGFDPALVRSTCWNITYGASDMLFSKTDLVLREPPFHASFDNAFAADYVGGRGVMLRYATEKAVQEIFGQPFCPDGIKATAAAVWNSREAPNQFTSLWNAGGDASFNQTFVQRWGTGDPSISYWDLDGAWSGVLQANGLDALTAAIRLR